MLVLERDPETDTPIPLTEVDKDVWPNGNKEYYVHYNQFG